MTADSRNIFVFCDYKESFDYDYILQILTKAKKLSKQFNGMVMAVCIGKYEQVQFEHLLQYGAEVVLFYEFSLACNEIELCDIISDMIHLKKPQVMLFPATQTGKAVSAMLSTRFEAGLTADCIDIDLDDEKKFYYSRAAMNDSVIAKIQCIGCNIEMCTIKKNVFVKEKYGYSGQGKIEVFKPRKEYNSNDLLIQVLEVMTYEKKVEIDISKCQVVFCIGRGVKRPETLNKLYEIAKLCGVEIVGTRAVVEEGLIQKERQVGQSGKIISPRVYIGFGVSGASQHMVGIKNANLVVAVNNDPEAPIFNYADYAIVEDIDVLLEELVHLLNYVA